MRVLVASAGFSPSAVERMRSAAEHPGNLAVVPCRSLAELAEAMVADPEVLISDHLPDRAGPSLRWIQLLSAGVDGYGPSPVWADPAIRITTAAGVSAPQIAAHAMALVLYRLMALGPRLAATRAGDWTDPADPISPVRGKVLGIIGMGSIGTRVAAIARELGFRVVATGSGRATAPPARYRADWVAELERQPSNSVPVMALGELLSSSDVIVVSAPLTPDTHRLIDAEALRQVKPGALLVNVGRGAIIDEAAMLDALSDGTLTAACLDVTVQEPLPADSPLVAMDNVDITPHVAGWYEGYYDDVADLVCQNLTRYRRDDTLINLIDARTRPEHTDA